MPTPQAQTRKPRWPGLIWAVPVAALAIVGWLALRSYLDQGPTVTVEFPTSGGIKPNHTVVKYRGVTVGRVTATRLAKSLNEMAVTLRFEPYMAGHLGKGTRYWIAGKEVSFTDLSSLKSLIAGPYIGVDPHPGATVHKVTGLLEEPVLKSEPKGLTLVLTSQRFDSVQRAAPILYQGMQIGEVRGKAQAPDGHGFLIYAFISEKYLHLINARSRFWNSGSVRFQLLGKDSGLHIPPADAIFSGAISVLTPESAPPAKEDMRFPLYPNAEAARWAPGKDAVAYQIVLPGGPQGLTPGAAVQLEGQRVGTVTAVQMRYDPTQKALLTRVDLVLEPQHIPLLHAQWNIQNPRPQMDAMLRALIARGLRAELTQNPPLVGSPEIVLEHLSHPQAARLLPGNPPQIPFVAGGTLSNTLTQVDGILREIHALPLPEIAHNLQVTTQQIAALSRSQQTRQTLAHLAAATRHLNAILAAGQQQLPATLQHVQKASSEAEKALQAADALLAANGSAGNAPESSTLPRTLYELRRAAVSLRELTDYLNSHPNALLIGK
ncbi:MAG: MCE family protein [Acidithiobacillus sp.]|nr:MCE family protein [Acidithiobacillus sp.]